MSDSENTMGVTLCKKHGKTGIIIVCTHLGEMTYKFQNLPKVFKVIEREEDPNDEFGYEQSHYLCFACYEKYGNNKNGFKKTENDLLDAVCSKCFLELLNLENWN